MAVSQLCGRNFFFGEIMYTCRDCATGPFYVLCADCFMNSIHRNHRFQVRLASLGAYCDCGDLSAWKTGPCCARHREMALVSSLFSQLLLLERLQTVQTAMETRPRNSQPCRRVFRAGDTVYSCRNCIKTPNTVLCQDCFQNSIHKHHQFEAFVCNVSDGYCDCGDLSAWKTGPCCSKHSSGPSVPSATTAPSGNAVPSSPEPRTCLPQRATASATSAAAPKVSERSKTSKAATTTQTTKPAPLATPQNTRPTPSSARRLSMRKEVSSKVLPPSANEFAQDLRRAQTEAPVKAEESVGAMGTGVRTSAPAQCRRKIKRGENIYSCRDCAMDPTCVLCQDCFQNSGHKSHSYKTRVSSSGSSICSCGDVDGWRSASCCSKHNPDSTQRAPSSACSWDQQEDPVHPRSPLNGCTVTMRAPVCLIDNGLDGRMSVQQEALQILEQIQQPVVVVAVVGLYRTGKSYLMNRLAGQNAGFALGRTIESKTKGIWMWCIPHPLKAGHTLVLLDTEGLGDVQKGDEKHDTWIFCLAVLLSSTLVYNSMGTIDNTALEKLHYVTELTEHIRVKCSEHNRNTELMRIFPSFVWTVRDFTLDLELEGKPITADEYLESALKLKEGSSPEVEKHNKLRQSLRDFFAVRRCFVMERPASGEKMKCVAELTDTDLEPGFVQQAQEFCSYIHHSAQVKTMRGGLGLTGRMLGSLAETYVKAIRSGQVPCLESAVESLALIQNSRAVAESLDYYKKEMKCRVQFPTETQEALSNIHSAVEKQTISIFINVSFNDSEQKYQQELMTTIEEEYNKLCTKNGSKSCEVCKSVISQVFAPLEAGLKNGSYMRPGGFEDFRRALNTGAQLYRSVKCKGVMSEVVLSKYLEKKSGDARGILAADRSLSEAQRKTEENRVKLEEAELQKKRQEQRTQVLQQLMLDQKRSHDENMRQLEEKMERERQNAHEELERVVAAKLMEQKRLQNSGFRERAQGMEEDILKMRQEQKTLKDKKRRWLGRLGSGLQAVGPVAALLPCPGVLIGLAAVAIGSFLKMFD